MTSVCTLLLPVRVLVLQAQSWDFLVVFHPPQAPIKFLSSSPSSSPSSFILFSLPHSLLFSSIGSKPFLSTCLSLGLENRPAPSHSLLICLTTSALWLLNLFPCVRVCVCVSMYVCLCVCVSLSHSLVFFSSACRYSPPSIPSVCHGIPLHPVSFS